MKLAAVPQKSEKPEEKGSVYTRLMEITGSWYRSWKVR